MQTTFIKERTTIIMKLRKIISVVLLVCTVFGSALSAEAATYGNAASSGTYTNVGKDVEGNYTHYIYKNSYNWILYYTGKKLTPVTYHVTNHGDDVLAFSTSQTIETVETKSWSVNASITLSVSSSIEGIFEAGIETTSELGYGSEYAWGRSFTSSSGVDKTIKDSAPTGYYTRVPGRTFYKMKDIAVYTTRSSMDMFYYDMPYGSMVIYTLYSKNNASWSIY